MDTSMDMKMNLNLNALMDMVDVIIIGANGHVKKLILILYTNCFIQEYPIIVQNIMFGYIKRTKMISKVII